MYRDRVDVVSDLRVHNIPFVMDFYDYSAAATGMVYGSSTTRGGVAIDGRADAVSKAVPTWEAITGPQGQVLTRATLVTDLTDAGGVDASTEWFYRDQTNPPEEQCWGDGSLLGANGPFYNVAIPNTDPRETPFATVQARRTTQFEAPADDPRTIPAAADEWSADLATPLTATASPYRP